jgi:hypothetical protein
MPFGIAPQCGAVMVAPIKPNGAIAMGQEYSDPERQGDKWSLPDLEVFQLTAREVAEQDEEMIHDYMRRHEFKLAAMNSRVRERMFDTMIEEQGIEGGWFYWYCFPGCMPDCDATGPFASYAEALAAAREEQQC